MTPFRRARPVSVSALLLSLALLSRAGAQSECGVAQGGDSDILPAYSGTLANVISTGGESSYVYILTSWGFVRASLADPGSPSALAIGNVGLRYSFGTPPDYNGGKVPIACDCAQGGAIMAVAQDPGGNARMFSDWRAAVQGGGLPGQVARADGAGSPAFAQQINIPQPPLGSNMAAIYLPASGKYIAYFPTDAIGLKIVDATVTTGDASSGGALVPIGTFSGFPDARLLQAVNIAIGGTPKAVLIGVAGDGLIRLAEIDPVSGIPTNLANAVPAGFVFNLTIANVNNRVFIFSAELAGLRVYEYAAGAISPIAGALISGLYDRVLVKGGQFPAIFAHRSFGASSFIDIYDTKWLTQAPLGVPRLAKSLHHRGAPVAEPFRGSVFEAVVKENGAVVTAYVYRLKTTTVFNGEHILATDRVDISCIAADPTAPPVANAIHENISAQARTGAERAINYYGDKWRIRDASSSGVALDQIEWDWNYAGSFLPDSGWSSTLPDTSFSDVNPAYFPCEPAAAGNVRTGGGCHLSLGNPTSGGSYQYALRTHNANGWAASPYASGAIAVAAPQAQIAGFSGGVLQVLSGGQADARSSQGNTAEATFAWNFTGGTGGTATGQVVTVPTGATAFALTVAHPGGYTATASGSIVQVDLVPNFAITPNPSVKSGTLTLTNQMQIGSAVVNSVDYVVNTGAPPSPFGGSALAASFHTVGGTATITAPGTSGAYNVHLRYSYTAGGQPYTALVTKPLTVVDVTVSPIIGIYQDSSKTRTADFFGGVFYLSVGATYYLFDDETLSPHPGAQWSYFAGGAETPMGATPGAGPLSFVFTNDCTTACSVKLTVSGVSLSRTISVALSGPPLPPPPPPPPPGGSVSAFVSGPSTVVRGNPATFTGNASGGTPPYTYAFKPGDAPAFEAYQVMPSGSFTFTYTALGSYTVSLRVTDSLGVQGLSTHVINVTAPVGPPPVVSLSGPARGRKGTPVTFTATSSSGTGAHTYAWRFGDNPLGGGYLLGPAVNSYTYSATGLYTVSVRVTDSAGATATASRDITIDPAFAALIVPGSAHLDLGDGNIWGTDLQITNTGPTPMELELAFVQYFAGASGTLDLSQLTYTRIEPPIPPGGNWSKTDVVAFLAPGRSDKGTVIVKYTGASVPSVNGRVYFAKKDNPLGASYGAAIEAYQADPAGRRLGRSSLQGIDGGTDQTLVGLASTDLFRFALTLYNSSGEPVDAKVTAFDGDGEPVMLKDDAGNPTLPSRTVRINAFQQSYFRNEDLIAADPQKKYVFKVSRVGSAGSLIAYGTALDKKTSDLVQFTDDTPAPISKANADGTKDVEYYIPGVSRFDNGQGAKWRTGFVLRSSAATAMGVLFRYRYTVGGAGPEKVAERFEVLEPGKLVAYDDIVGSFFDDGTQDDLKALSTFGVITLTYREFVVSENAPFSIVARNYDDQPSGTAGTQLSVFSRGDGVAVDQAPLILSGAEEDSGPDPRLRTVIGVFAMDDVQTRVRVTLVRKDGTVVGKTSHEFVLNQPGGLGRLGQIFMSNADVLPDIVRDEPMSVRAEVLEGGEAGVYLVTVDTHTRDTSFLKGRLPR